MRHNNLFNLFRNISITFIIALGLINIVATGGDGGNSNPSEHDPSISNLEYSPTSATVGSGEGTISVSVSVAFGDEDGNISSLIIDIFDSEGTNIPGMPIEEDIEEEFSGKIYGTIEITIQVGTSVAGDYTFDVYIIDTTNRESNTLTGEFSIISCDYNIDIVCEDGCEKTCQKNSGSPDNFILFNDKLIFTAYEGCKNISQQKLFELDEIGNITEIIESGLRINSEKTILHNMLYFISDGYLYKYDGSNQAQKIFPDYTESIFAIQNLMAYNNKIYFYYSAFDDELYYPGLYSYDGSGIPEYLGGVKAAGNYAAYNGNLYFRGYTEEYGNELWCYDADGNLNMVDDINPGDDSIGSMADFNIVIFQEKLFFSANDGTNGCQLWMIYDEDPPVMVTELTGVGTGDSWIRPVAVFQENLLCEVSVHVESETYIMLYEYDGTSLIPLPADQSYDSHMWLYYSQDINSYVILNDHFYFLAVDTSIGIWNAQFVWDYDGKTAPIKIDTGDYISNIYPHNGKLLLQAYNNERIYSYAGNSEPEVLFKIDNLAIDIIYLEKVFCDNYFVSGQNETYGRELWVIDDSGEINLVKDFYPGTSCDCDCGD